MSVEKSIVRLIRRIINKNKVVKVEILWLVREESELLGLELLFACRYFLFDPCRYRVFSC